MDLKSTKNARKSRQDTGKAQDVIAKSTENIGKSKDRSGKSENDVNKQTKNIGEPRENYEKTQDGDLTKEPSIETLPNPNFFWGTDSFTLENGDVYDGDYCCHKSGIIWREGLGTYSTKDGHIYTGVWENDQLLSSPESHIIFPTSAYYLGSVVNGQYSGQGSYVLENKLILHANFVENVPVGQVTLTDHDKQQWKGTSTFCEFSECGDMSRIKFNAGRRTNITSEYCCKDGCFNYRQSEAEENKTMIYPVNHFFENIPPERGVGAVVPKQETDTVGEVPSPSLKSQALDEATVFAKSKKTANDFSFDKYSLKSSSEFATQFFKSKIGDDSSVSLTLLKTFLSKEYRNKSKPIKIFFSTSDQAPVEKESVLGEAEETKSTEMI